jgi:hypothetical protein
MLEKTEGAVENGPSIQKHKQQWAPKTKDEVKQKGTTQKTKKTSNTDPT